MALGPFTLGRHLRRDHPVRLFVGEAPYGVQPGAAQRDAGIHQHHRIELRRVEHLEQQRNVVHDQDVAALGGFAHQLVAVAAHRRVDDGVEGVERRLITHHLAAQRGAIERPVGREHVDAEPLRDRGQHRAAGRLGLARQLVGVDDRRAPATK